MEVGDKTSKIQPEKAFRQRDIRDWKPTRIVFTLSSLYLVRQKQHIMRLKKRNFFSPLNTLLAIALITTSPSIYGQKILLSENEAIDLAVKNYPLIISSLKKIEQQKALIPSYLNLPNTEVLIQAPTGDEMRASILQMIDFPTVYAAQKKSLKTQVAIAEAEKETNVNLVKFSVKTAYNNLLYSIERESTLKRYDSILSDLIGVNEIRYKVGQIAILEKINGEAKYKISSDKPLQTEKTTNFNWLSILANLEIAPISQMFHSQRQALQSQSILKKQ